ncbi:hypothetical protein M433DRAFT_74081 [Acidomyces richmondensis BFW]|nr:MAG: hypothetical protein FE78DRAFT_106202 [Acidomyces sp. 'richmondensis']KYG42295.1 hypothetical protein M433DRAFT_74081 [Acidomyces richmondensis BFW]
MEPLGPAVPCVIEYLNEGGANLVFKVLRYGHAEVPAKLKGRLLRIRKDTRHAHSTVEQFKGFRQNFMSLFPPHQLVEHELVRLDEGIPYVLNTSLKRLDRPSHRKRDFLSEDERYGLLITDMTAQCGEVLVQMKPKWLAQSPNAPPNAKRCRTCALRALRLSERRSTATDAQASCPLELVSESADDRRRAAVSLTADQLLQDYLVDQGLPLLHTLRDHQQLLDKEGSLSVTDACAVHDLCKAMTLRDCTLFIKRSGFNVEARLGDMDLKHPAKLCKWKKIEQDLIDGGWYTNTEAKDRWVEERTCMLSQQ